MKDNNTISWFQFNNIFPIVISFVGIAFSFAAWTSRVSVLETKMDIVIQQQKEILAKYSGVETRYGELSLKVQELQTKVSLR
jgi:hypothetical protein